MALRNDEAEDACHRTSPEKALLCAVLERAWNDLINNNTSQDEQKSAREWFLSRSELGYSFRWIVSQLDWKQEEIAYIVARAQATEFGLSRGERIDSLQPTLLFPPPYQSPLEGRYAASFPLWSLLE